MNAPFLSPIPPIFSRSSVSSVSSSTSKRRGLLRASAPVLLALVLGVGLAGCDDTASTSSDAPSSTAPSRSRIPAVTAPLTPGRRLLRSPLRSRRTTRLAGAAGSVAVTRVPGRAPRRRRPPSLSLRRSSTPTVTTPRLPGLHRCTRVTLATGPSWIGIRTASPAIKISKA